MHPSRLEQMCTHEHEEVHGLLHRGLVVLLVEFLLVLGAVGLALHATLRLKHLLELLRRLVVRVLVRVPVTEQGSPYCGCARSQASGGLC